MSFLENFGQNLKPWVRRVALIALLGGCTRENSTQAAEKNELGTTMEKVKRCYGALISGPIEETVRTEATKRGIDVNLAKAQLMSESLCDPNAVSPAGAQGLMQLNPRYHTLNDPFDPTENIQRGLDEDQRLLRKYNGDVRLALAAYNAGQTVVDRCQCVPDYPETQGYVKKILARKELLDLLNSD